MIEKRFRWLINLRWLAACGALIAIVLIDFIFAFPLPVSSLYVIIALLLTSNMFYLYFQRRASLSSERRYAKLERLVVIQIIFDLILLTFLLHFSGGVENPFIIYYVFHMMLAGILLSQRISLLLTSFAIFLVGLMAMGEYLAWLPHYQLKGFLTTGFYDNLRYLTGTGFVFVTTSFVVVYLTSNVSALLRKKEAEYRRANIELREKDAIKDGYVFRVTHDIKGHLAAIKNCLDASLTNLPHDQQKSFLERAHGRTDKLLSFIQELLRITKLRLNNEMVFAAFSLNELITELLPTFDSQARDKGIELRTELQQDEFFADKLSILEVIENLLSNSLKYTNPGGEIVIRSSLDPSGKTIIQVADSGIGISDKEKKKVFGEFFKASNNKGRVQDGTGIGLAIVRMIMEQHKGKVIVESEENKGTVFTLEFPDISGLPENQS